jgi:hypothetical protein
MKKLIIILIVILSTVNTNFAQSIYLSEDSMNNSENPGKYFLDQLQPNTIFDEGDTVEGDVKHAISREYSFWLDRMPGGSNVDSPFYKYNYMMRNYKTSSCIPKIGDFNGNWENTGPKTASQSQGRVYDVYVKPVPYPATPTEMWIGTGNAGLWKTMNGGTNWTNVSDNWSPSINGAGVSSIAVNPFYPYKMYISTKMEGNDQRRNYMAWEYGQGIWYSNNGGNTWTIDLAGLGSYDYMDFIEYCPYQLNGGTDEMIIGTRYNRVYQKIGTGAWADVTPAALLTTPLLIRDITFGPNGKFYISTQHNYVGGIYVGPKVIEFNYTPTGVLTSSTIINDNNNTNKFVFFGVPNADAIAFETGYAGGNNLYVMVVAFPSPSGATEGHHTLYNYNISTGALTLEHAMPNFNLEGKSMWRTSVTVSPNNPNVIYVEGVRPYRLSKGVNGWSEYEYPNTGWAFHDDGLISRIYHTDPSNMNNDIVYWGNDGGLTRTIGTNTQTNLNGDLITNEVYDVDVAELGKKRAVTTYDNGLHVKNGSNAWEFQHNGDGFTAIYETRFDKFNVPLLYHHDAVWNAYTHGNSLSGGGQTQEYPRRMIAGSIDIPRAFEFPHSFDNGYMYGGNKNLLRSTSMGYGTLWTRETMGGDLNGLASTIKDNCRAFAVSKDLGNGAIGQRMYYGLRRPLADALGKYHVFYARDIYGNWHDWTPLAIKDGINLTDIVIDDKDPTRVFISMGMVDWGVSIGAPVNNRVLRGDYDPVNNIMNWTPMNSGLSELPVTCLVYQAGSDDIIYAGTDAGVYRWDKPQGCWVKFNDMQSGAKMPGVIVHDMVIDYCGGKLVMGSYGRGVWETDLYEPNFYPGVTEEITLNTTWGFANGPLTNKYIKGSVLVKSGKTLTIQGIPNVWGNTATSSTTTIYMPKNGQILVEKGAKLVINGAHVTNECDAMWSGVSAYGYSGNQQYIQPSTGYDSDHGIVSLEYAIIENTQEALNNGGGASNLNTGGILRAKLSHFINNRRSVCFGEYHNVWFPNTLKPDESFFMANRFDVNDNIRTGFFAHATLWGVTGVRFYNNEFYNTQNLNSSHLWALYTLDATYNLEGNNVVGGQSIVEGFHNGVESSSFIANSLYPTTIYNTRFDKNEIGIHFNTVIFPEITSNDIRIGMKQSPYPNLPNWSYYSLGSKLVHVNNFKYSNNLHTKPYSAPSNNVFQYTAGTEVFNTGKGDENIHRNEYYDLLIGNDCADECGDGTSSGLTYTCNSNYDNIKYDFILQANAIVKPIQSNGVNATGNILTQNNPSILHWDHVIGGNGPIDYHYNMNATNNVEELTYNFNVTQVGSTPSGCAQSALALPITNQNPEYTYKSELLNYDFEALKNQFYTESQDYNEFKTLYNQLIDNGNTPEVIEDIQGNVLSEEMQTRADMLAMSPYVSREALMELAQSNIVSNPILFEIIMANPDASKSDGFIDFLMNDLPVPLPAYMINLIRQSWHGSTARTILEKNISIKHVNMTDLKNKILKGMMVSDTLNNADSIYHWMTKVGNLTNSYQLIEIQLNKRNFTTSDSMLNQLTTQYRMTTKDLITHNAFIDLYNFKKSLLEDSVKINQLDSARIQQLKVIADASEFTFPRSMARNALCFFYQICYPDTVRELPITSSKMPPIAKEGTMDKLVTVYPNPAKDYVTFYYNLVEGNEAVLLLVMDFTGKKVYTQKLNGKEGQHIWDTRTMSNGNYIYTLTNNLGEKYTGKLTIKK